MNLKVAKCLAPVALLAALAIPAMAQPLYPDAPPAHHHVGGRFENQHDRIHQGVVNGSLTRREQYRLDEREDRIHAQAYRDRLSGGRFTPREHRHIERDLNRTSHDMYRQRHDNQHR